MSNTVKFFCEECKNQEAYDATSLKRHLKEKHGITGQLKGSQKGVAFLDGEKGYFAQTWDVTLKPSGLKLTKVIEGGGK